MEYNDNITTFVLEGFGKASRLHYLYAACIFLLYLLMVSANLLLIAVIVLRKCLHEPMYIFICNLSINALYGSTSVLPKLIVDLVSERKTISYLGCHVQLFFMHSFTIHEITIITVMAYDRYIAIWTPLRYAVIMTKEKMFQHRLDASTIPSPVIVFMSLEFIMVPPLFNPIIYGIRTEKIRKEIIKLFRKRINHFLTKSSG
nr:PREDICTED: olfactory receptor 4P4-like [Latimeria chalumnae]|eukprot:XP_014353087.1 PREDICTED: olfactory receptor 4P4-like [Latimeria chalumnae]